MGLIVILGWKMLIITLIILSTLACAGLSNDTTKTFNVESSVFPYTVTDARGNAVTFQTSPRRIVAMDSAVVETLFAIGEGDRVVGVHDFVSYPPATDGLPRVGDAYNINIEAVVSLEPDLVCVFSGQVIEDLQRAGLTVLYLESLQDDFRKTSDNIRMWGRITGSLHEANVIASKFDSQVAEIEDIMKSQVGELSVFQDEGDFWTPGPDTLINDVFTLLKLNNIAYDVKGYAQLSPEIIVSRDPQIIIASYGDTISRNLAFKNVTAVKNGRIFVPQSDALSVPGPRYVEGINDLARWVYPDLFE